MDDPVDLVPDWVVETCRIARIWRDRGQVSVLDLFVRAAPDLSDRQAFEAAVRRHLRRNLDLVNAWQDFVQDQRASPLPYVRGNEVGFYDKAVTYTTFFHPNEVSACADYLFREAVWVLEGRRVDGPGSISR